MQPSRRRMLALTSSLSLPLLTGCLGLLSEDEAGGTSGSDGSGGGSDSGGSGGGSSDGGEGEAEATETETATPEPPDGFLTRTRTVMDEIRWFGTQYEQTRRQYILALKPVQETIARQQELNTLTESDVAELRSQTQSLASFVREEVAPHFDIDFRLRNGDNGLVQDFASAVEQDDTAAQQDALSRLSIFYNRVSKEAYIEQNLSAHPIEDPLHSNLGVGGKTEAIFGLSYPPGDNFTTQTFSDEYSDRTSDGVRPHEHTFETGQRVYAHAHEYDSGHDLRSHQNERPDGIIYAFSEGSIDILRDSKAWREELIDYQPEYTNVFDATVSRNGRVDYAYVMANKYVTKTDPDNDKSKEQFGGKPIFVQRYEDEGTAAAALETLFSTTLGEDGTTTLAGREWTRVFYDYDGPNLYANVIQVGEFIITASVSAEPHRERSEDEQWPEQLKLSWIAMEVEES